MKINEVIERHGMQLRDVSREMGMKPSALQSAIDRNLTVKTLRQISEAAKIPIAEFFFDELKSDPKWVERFIDGLTDTDRQQLLAALNPAQPAASAAQQPSTLPFGGTTGGQPSATSGSSDAAPHQSIPDDAPTRSLSALAHQPSLQQAIICPHCGHALVMNVVSEE